jgi:hypothetical protein
MICYAKVGLEGNIKGGTCNFTIVRNGGDRNSCSKLQGDSKRTVERCNILGTEQEKGSTCLWTVVTRYSVQQILFSIVLLWSNKQTITKVKINSTYIDTTHLSNTLTSQIVTSTFKLETESSYRTLVTLKP